MRLHTEGTPEEIAEFLKSYSGEGIEEKTEFSIHKEMVNDCRNEKHYSFTQGKFVKIGDMEERYAVNVLKKLLTNKGFNKDLTDEEICLIVHLAELVEERVGRKIIEENYADWIKETLDNLKKSFS